MAGDEPRTLKLFCPSLTKVSQLVGWDDQKLDLGSIARTFGLEPSTLKINGHFIGRGVDLIASSVTWRSLLSFFSSRGLSTGKDESDAIIVEGKLSKVGAKRAHVPQDAEIGIWRGKQHENGSVIRGPEHKDMTLLRNKKLKESDSGCGYRGVQSSQFHRLGLKRKQLLEDFSLLKRLKLNETGTDCQQRGEGVNSISCTQLKCSFMSENMKRMREDEAIMTASCKKIR